MRKTLFVCALVASGLVSLCPKDAAARKVSPAPPPPALPYCIYHVVADMTDTPFLQPAYQFGIGATIDDAAVFTSIESCQVALPEVIKQAAATELCGYDFTPELRSIMYTTTNCPFEGVKSLHVGGTVTYAGTTQSIDAVVDVGNDPRDGANRPQVYYFLPPTVGYATLQSLSFGALPSLAGSPAGGTSSASDDNAETTESNDPPRLGPTGQRAPAAGAGGCSTTGQTSSGTAGLTAGIAVLAAAFIRRRRAKAA